MAEPDPPVFLVIGTPCYGGQVTHMYMMSVLALQSACRDRGIGFDLILLAGDAHIARARSTIMTRFMDNPAATHLLFIDADIGFEPDAVFRLLDFGADLSGGLYPIKGLDWERARRYAGSDRDFRAAAMNYVTGFADPRHIEHVGQFAKAVLLGTGFMMIRRRVFTVLAERHPELRFRRVHATPDPHADSPHRFALFDSLIDERGFYLPEDYSFCRRWTDAGGAIWVDLGSRLNHLGMYRFAGDTSHMLPGAGVEAPDVPG